MTGSCGEDIVGADVYARALVGDVKVVRSVGGSHSAVCKTVTIAEMRDCLLSCE